MLSPRVYHLQGRERIDVIVAGGGIELILSFEKYCHNFCKDNNSLTVWCLRSSVWVRVRPINASRDVRNGLVDEGICRLVTGLASKCQSTTLD